MLQRARKQRDPAADDIADLRGGLRNDRLLRADLLAKPAIGAKTQLEVDAVGGGLCRRCQRAGRATLHAGHASRAGLADAALAPRQLSPRQIGSVFAQHRLVARRVPVFQVHWR